MATVDFLYHENLPTWAVVEPANQSAEGQRQTNYTTQPAYIIQDGFYRLGTSEGISKQVYARSQFTLCPKNRHRIEASPDRSITIVHSSGSDQ
ncbi:hypothetical protein TNCV_996971 [Trichonephila clavipes]|nr:hypothetical protein TNCV_996971 [Trichonephila clavipes]